MEYQCWILLENKRFLLGISPYDSVAREIFEGRQVVECHLYQFEQFLTACDRIEGIVSYCCNATFQAWIIVEFRLRGELRIGALKMDLSAFRTFVSRYKDGSPNPISLNDYMFWYNSQTPPPEPWSPPRRIVKEATTEKTNWKREGF